VQVREMIVRMSLGEEMLDKGECGSGKLVTV